MLSDLKQLAKSNKENVIKPLLAGAAAGVASKFVLKASDFEYALVTFPVELTPYRVEYVIGALVAASSFASEMAFDYLFDIEFKPVKNKKVGPLLATPLITGTTAWVGANTIMPNAAREMGLKLGLVGAGAEFVAQRLSEYWELDDY